MSQHIIGPLPSERQNNQVIGLLARRRISAEDLQADHVGAMNAVELKEWLKVKLNPVCEVDGEAGDGGQSHDEQRTPLRGTLPPITAGRANEDGMSVFGYEG